MNKRVNVREFRLPHTPLHKLPLGLGSAPHCAPRAFSTLDDRERKVSVERCRENGPSSTDLEGCARLHEPERERSVLIPGRRDIKMVRRQQHGRSNWISPTIAGTPDEFAGWAIVRGPREWRSRGGQPGTHHAIGSPGRQ
jgi:hypothetical protein